MVITGPFIANPAGQIGMMVTFGPFTLRVGERLLKKDGVPVELGGRTLDILIALLSRPNEIIGKKELMAQVWPDVIVEESSLRFHVAGLRKALGDGADGARYITTLAGRGYCFVAPVSLSAARASGNTMADAPFQIANFLPARLARMVGRADSVDTLLVQLMTTRFVTIVGPGGVGKTTVAVAVAHGLMESFAGAVAFLDLGMLNDPNMAASSLASMLGLSVQSNDPIPTLIAYLHDKTFLLVLDNCEHIIDGAANLAARIYMGAPQVHILATTREALRVEGEQVHNLMPLAIPPDDPNLTAEAALAFPATQLFVERAAASGAHLDLNDADIAVVTNICRKLDGMALAIELTAGRVGAYGLQQTAALLDQRLSLLWLGKRTAPPRQKTLQATLDWSCGLLSEHERQVLRHLAVFVGYFTLDAARAVVTNNSLNEGQVLAAIDNLIAKSMVVSNRVGTKQDFRLLDTTRTYALQMNASDAEIIDLAARHATYYRQWLGQTADHRANVSTGRAPDLADLGNVRAALEWSFGPNGNPTLAFGLAANAAPFFLDLSMVTECHHWSEQAVLALDDTTRGSIEEMNVQEALGLALMFTRSNSETARAALARSLVIAEERGESLTQIRLLGFLHMYYHRIANYETTTTLAKRSLAVSRTVQNPAAIALAHSHLGISLFLSGDLNRSRVEFEAAQRHSPSKQIGHYQDFDDCNFADIGLARTLLMLGLPSEALLRTHQSIKEVEDTNNPVALCSVLIWSISIFLCMGELKIADDHVNWFISYAQSRSLGPYLAAGRGFKGQLAILHDDAKRGVDMLRESLDGLHQVRYELLTPEFNISLIEGLIATDRYDKGLILADETVSHIQTSGGYIHMPEALRVKANALLAKPNANIVAVENCLFQSLEWSNRQEALTWELRSSVDLAKLWKTQGRADKSQALLQSVLEKFAQRADSPDLKAAETLLATLGNGH